VVPPDAAPPDAVPPAADAAVPVDAEPPSDAHKRRSKSKGGKAVQPAQAGSDEPEIDFVMPK
jgi:hypothetical protein